MSEGIGRDDLKNGAVNYEKLSHGGRLVTFTAIHEGPASGDTELALLAIPSQDFQVTRAFVNIDHDGTGSVNEVEIDILDDGATILTAINDLIVGTDAASDAPEACALDPALTLIAKDSVLQAEFVGAGTVTTVAHVAVTVEGYYVD